MPGIRVELLHEAADDLASYATTSVFPLILAKLLRLEREGPSVGLPLGRSLVGWRKIVVGDRDWRIVFMTNADATVATVAVIAERDDDTCYRLAERRLAQLGNSRPQAVTLAAILYNLLQRRETRRSKSRRNP